MISLTTISVFVLLVCVFHSEGDLVDDVTKKIQETHNHMDGTLTKAKEQLKNLKGEYSKLAKGRRKMDGTIKKGRNDEYNKITRMGKNLRKEMTASKANEGLKDLAMNLASEQVQDFHKDFVEYESFLTNKEDEFAKKQAALESKWTVIDGIDDWIAKTKERLNNVSDADVIKLEEELYLISRQVQLQQFHEEEKTRSDGNSGIKQIRNRNAGEKNYFSNTHSGGSFAAIHNHANNIRTVGMGEFIGVLNGVEFRTRHNDYRLRQPVTDDKTFHATKDIEFPEVPPEVLNAGGPEEQVEEMRKWFKAFYDQDHTVRDYRKYFKPVMTYLEGAWTTNSGDSIDEPFESDRHHIDAKGWFDLQEKIHFTSYTGTKSRLENLAHLPTTIMDFTKNGKPIFAQWNYRILCHPLTKDLPLKYLKVVRDPSVQKMKNWDDTQYSVSRAAKFDIEGIRTDGRRVDSFQRNNLLDTLMEEIPGKDNYGAWVTAHGFDAKVFSQYVGKDGKLKPLNGGYYHRRYKLSNNDAMGINTAQRGFADRYYMALTTQERVSGPSHTKTIKNADGSTSETKVNSRASYAIPVEIIYLTPLAKWNPYNIEHKDENNDIQGKGTFEEPFTNTVPKNFFRTPHTFFTGEDSDRDPADTAKAGGVYFLPSGSNKPVAVHASGIRIMFPPIAGIPNKIRQRYPIMPVYGEGSSVWKTLNAVEDSIDFESVTTSSDVYYSTGISHSENERTHSHIVVFNQAEIEKLKKGEVKEVVLYTERGNSHMHKIAVIFQNGKLIIKECDTPTGDPDMTNVVCWDNHSNELKTSADE